MSMSLKELRQAGRDHLMEQNEDGFTILRRDQDDASEFNAFARAAINSLGEDFIAFPQPDGDGGYVGLFIIPLI